MSTPDLNASLLANLLTPWCGEPFQCFLGVNRESGHVNLAELVDDLHRDMFLDAQKEWFQLITKDFYDADRNRSESWSEQALSTVSRHDRWLISDSRLCHTAQFWKSRLNPDTSVLAYSEPLSCAVSLSKTWRFPVSFGLALWEHYLLSAVKNCLNQTVLVLSLHKFRSNREQFNHMLTGQLANFGCAEDDTLNKIQSVASPVFSDIDQAEIAPEDFVNDNQAGIFAELEEFDLEAIANRSLSTQSRDLLNHYGDLRAGYEKIKLKRGELQNELNALKAIQTEPKEDERQNQPDAEPLTETYPDSTDFVEVSVQIKDMQQLEFLCPKDAPILNTLQEVLQGPSKYTDKLLFLNYGQEGEKTLYFPGSSLFALNISAN